MPIKSYQKGARAERELTHFLNSRGFSCIRSASSGGFLYPVDVVALKKGRVLCFEIKSWAKKPKLEKKKLERFKEWCERADGFAFLGWYNENRWRFLTLKDAEAGNYDDDNWMQLNQLLEIFNI
ncbi:MAG: hypothetical protein ABIJ92_04965 [Candidatus Aenigmatarchaeota archaeon]